MTPKKTGRGQNFFCNGYRDKNKIGSGSERCWAGNFAGERDTPGWQQETDDAEIHSFVPSRMGAQKSDGCPEFDANIDMSLLDIERSYSSLVAGCRGQLKAGRPVLEYSKRTPVSMLCSSNPAGSSNAFSPTRSYAPIWIRVWLHVKSASLFDPGPHEHHPIASDAQERHPSVTSTDLRLLSASNAFQYVGLRTELAYLDRPVETPSLRYDFGDVCPHSH